MFIGDDYGENARVAQTGKTCVESRVFVAVVHRHQARVTTGQGGVDGDRPLDGEAREVMRSTRLGAGARQAFAAERLHTDDGADHRAVDIKIADTGALSHPLGR